MLVATLGVSREIQVNMTMRDRHWSMSEGLWPFAVSQKMSVILVTSFFSLTKQSKNIPHIQFFSGSFFCLCLVMSPEAALQWTLNKESSIDLLRWGEKGCHITTVITPSLCQLAIRTLQHSPLSVILCVAQRVLFLSLIIIVVMAQLVGWDWGQLWSIKVFYLLTGLNFVATLVFTLHLLPCPLT